MQTFALKIAKTNTAKFFIPKCVLILQYIKNQAKEKAKAKLSVETESLFYKRLSNYYLKDYLSNPTAESGKQAISKIGKKFEIKPGQTQFDWWEENALDWNHVKIPKNFQFIIPGLPSVMHAATDVLSMDNRKHLPYIDVPQLLGKNNPNTSPDADVKGGGKNISHLMHWATGVKNYTLDKKVLQEYFYAYEVWHTEGIDVFWQDALNDLIVEEAGRILGQQLANAEINKENLQEKLNEGFAEARAWLGSILLERQSELDSWITAIPRKLSRGSWRNNKTIDRWKERGLCHRLSEGEEYAKVRESDFTKNIIDIYVLVYEYENWKSSKGEIQLSPLIKGLATGKFDSLLEQHYQRHKKKNKKEAQTSS